MGSPAVAGTSMSKSSSLGGPFSACLRFAAATTSETRTLAAAKSVDFRKKTTNSFTTNHIRVPSGLIAKGAYDPAGHSKCHFY